MEKDDLIRSLFVEQDVTGYTGRQILDCVLSSDTRQICNVIFRYHTELPKVTTNSIPQFSNSEDVFNVIKIVKESPEPDLNWGKIGFYLCPRESKLSAKVKYGENQYKLAVQLGLAVEKKCKLTDFGEEVYRDIDIINHEELLGKLSLRIPLIQQAILNSTFGRFNLMEYMKTMLAPVTAVRRRSNVKRLLAYLASANRDQKLQDNLWNIVWEDKDEFS